MGFFFDNLAVLGVIAILLWAIFSQIPGTYSPFQGHDTTSRWLLALLWTGVLVVFYRSVYKSCFGGKKMWPFSWGPLVIPDSEYGVVPPCADKIWEKKSAAAANAQPNAQRERVYAAAAKAIESAIARPVINGHCDASSDSGSSSSSASSMGMNAQPEVNYSAAVGEFYNNQ